LGKLRRNSQAAAPSDQSQQRPTEAGRYKCKSKPGAANNPPTRIAEIAPATVICDIPFTHVS